MNITLKEFCNIDFKLFDKNPIIKRFGLSPIIADPTVLSPVESDGKWHLFCHTLFGIFHYESDDGLSFRKVQKITTCGMRPNINKIGDTYYLYYEKTLPTIKKLLATIGKIKWKSSIYLTKSNNLINWSTPKEVISYDREYENSPLGTSISNPFLLKVQDAFRLYFSAGLTFLNDCGFSEPTYISYAESNSPHSGFVSQKAPILSPNKKNKYMTDGCGCIKVYQLKDCYIGLINGIYTDDLGNSSSAIMLYSSPDGVSFTYEKHLITPQKIGDNNWMAQYVYACSLVEYDNKMYIYFNARDTANVTKGVEHIGVAIGEVNYGE